MPMSGASAPRGRTSRPGARTTRIGPHTSTGGNPTPSTRGAGSTRSSRSWPATGTRAGTGSAGTARAKRLGTPGTASTAALRRRRKKSRRSRRRTLLLLHGRRTTRAVGGGGRARTAVLVDDRIADGSGVHLARRRHDDEHVLELARSATR